MMRDRKSDRAVWALPVTGSSRMPPGAAARKSRVIVPSWRVWASRTPKRLAKRTVPRVPQSPCKGQSPSTPATTAAPYASQYSTAPGLVTGSRCGSLNLHGLHAPAKVHGERHDDHEHDDHRDCPEHRCSPRALLPFRQDPVGEDHHRE